METTEEELIIDNSLRRRAEKCHLDPQESFNHFVDRFAFSKKLSVNQVLEMKITEECKKILNVTEYTGEFS